MNYSEDECYSGPTLSISVNREGNRVHRLIDDTLFQNRSNKIEIRRDPMVAALFGAVPGANTDHDTLVLPTEPSEQNDF